jgi:hypothetical protein
MSHTFEFDSSNRILRCRVVGRFTDEDLREYYRLIGKYEKRTAPGSAILDCTAVTSFEASSETVRELAQAPPALADSSLPRFVVAPAPHIFGMARMFQSLGEETRPNLHIVHTSEEVWKFLGVAEPKFEPINIEQESGAGPP